MGHYRKKPVVVEAWQFGHPATSSGPIKTREDGSAYVTTIHGDDIGLEAGDWVIMEPDGIHAYPCKDAIFKASYEPI